MGSPWWRDNFARGSWWWTDDERNHPTPVAFVYGLVDASGVIRYVGQTRNPIARAQQHRRGGTSGMSTFSWARGKPWEHDEPRMVILETCCAGDALRREAFWIGEIERRAGELMNSNIPGGRRRSRLRYMIPTEPRHVCSACGEEIRAGFQQAATGLWWHFKRKCFKASEARAASLSAEVA